MLPQIEVLGTDIRGTTRPYYWSTSSYHCSGNMLFKNILTTIKMWQRTIINHKW